MFLWVIIGVCPPYNLLQVLVIFFSCYFSIQPFCYVLYIPIFYIKIALLFCIRLFVCPRAFSTNLLVEFLFVFWNGLFCLYCLTLYPYHLCLSSFANIFWFISSSCIVRSVCNFVLVFSFQHILVCFSFFSTFAYCWNFFTCPYSLISHPGFVFLFRVLQGTPILSQTYFAPA